MLSRFRVVAIEDIFEFARVVDLSGATRPSQACMAVISVPIPNIFITRFML